MCNRHDITVHIHVPRKAPQTVIASSLTVELPSIVSESLIKTTCKNANNDNTARYF